jgi:hypothetical protein
LSGFGLPVLKFINWPIRNFYFSQWSYFSLIFFGSLSDQDPPILDQVSVVAKTCQIKNIPRFFGVVSLSMYPNLHRTHGYPCKISSGVSHKHFIRIKWYLWPKFPKSYLGSAHTGPIIYPTGVDMLTSSIYIFGTSIDLNIIILECN